MDMISQFPVMDHHYVPICTLPIWLYGYGYYASIKREIVAKHIMLDQIIQYQYMNWHLKIAGFFPGLKVNVIESDSSPRQESKLCSRCIKSKEQIQSKSDYLFGRCYSKNYIVLQIHNILMIKVSDYIAKRLAERGIGDIFMISGGGAMHLNDSLGNHPALKYWTNHHEQACAIAAEGYYRASGKMAVVNVTSGPGGLNCLTGVMGQWTDSIPVLYLSGQVKYETTIYSCKELGLRQLGDQEVDIISVVKSLTKFSAVLDDPYDVKRDD